jgi:hypothetical protein
MHLRLNFRIGEAFDADDVRAGYVVRLSMAMNDMRTMYEAASVICPTKPKSLLGLDDYLRPFEMNDPDAVAEARAAAQDLRELLDGQFVAGRTVEREFSRIRNGVFHYGNRTEGVNQTAAAIGLATEEAGSLVSDGVSEGRARYADKIAQHMTF